MSFNKFFLFFLRNQNPNISKKESLHRETVKPTDIDTIK